MKTANQSIRTMGMAVLAGAILIVPSMAKAQGRNDRDDRKPRVARNNENRSDRDGKFDGRHENGKFDRDGRGNRDFDRDREFKGGRDKDFGRRDGKFGLGGGKFGHGGGQGGNGFFSAWGGRPVFGGGRVEKVWVPPVYETRERKIWVEPVYDLRERCVTYRDRFGRVHSRIETDRVLVREGFFRIVTEQVLVTPGHYVERHCEVETNRFISFAGNGFNFGINW